MVGEVSKLSSSRFFLIYYCLVGSHLSAFRAPALSGWYSLTNLYAVVSTIPNMVLLISTAHRRASTSMV